jgi:NADH-quinone oxidoreductase subunit H
MNMMNFVKAFLLVLGAFVFQTSITGINRKVSARLQKRRGPKWYQQFLDIFKALSKSSISHGWVYDFGVVMALGGIMATVIFIPVASFRAFPDMDNIFVISYVLAVGMLGMAMSASGSGNPWASIGVGRALTSMLAYEVPFMIVVLTMIFAFDTSSVGEIADIQNNIGIVGWNIFRMPLGAIVGFISLQGMLGKKPFDNFIAPAEIASGPMVEYGGKHLGMLFILHDLSTFIEVSLIVNFFLGGGKTFLEFGIKYFVVYTLANIVSGVMPRFKIEQMVLYFYKFPLIAALVQGFIVIYTGWGVTAWL